MDTLNPSHHQDFFSPPTRGNSAPKAFANDFHQSLSASSATPFCDNLNFLLPHVRRLHSIVVIGSTAHEMQTDGSDLDIVVIVKENYLENICEAVFENDIETNCTEPGSTNLEVTVLTESQIEELFSMASPFAFAIRYGMVLFDDLYLATMLSKSHPRVPIREYYTKSLFEKVAYQYFCVVKQLEQAVKQKSCSQDCCEAENSSCCLLPSGTLPDLIFRMLYLTLPYRGLMPLSKDDAMAFAETFYSSEVSNAIKKAAALLRSKNDVIPFPVYQSLKVAAIKLFREILTNLQYQQDVRQIIHDAANCVRGNFTNIENSQLKKCFV